MLENSPVSNRESNSAVNTKKQWRARGATHLESSHRADNKSRRSFLTRAFAAVGTMAGLSFLGSRGAQAAELWDVRSATSGPMTWCWHGGDASGWQNAVDVEASTGTPCGIFPYKAWTGQMGWAECWAIQTACDYPDNWFNRRMRFHTFTPTDQIFGGILWSHVIPWITAGWTGTPNWVAEIGTNVNVFNCLYGNAHIHQNANGNRLYCDSYSYANATVYWNWWV